MPLIALSLLAVFYVELDLVNRVKGTIVAIVCLSCSVAWAQTEPSPLKNHDGDSVSFVKEVAPIVVAKCGKCHVANTKGQYGIASYEALMKSDSVTPNDPENSSFIEVIESGEMPKGGLKVSESELATLKKWIAEGAKFDGDDAQKALMEPAAASAGRGSRLQAVGQNPQQVGEEGVAWYVTWETAVAEAERSNRPIFFMSAAAQCSGVSGVF